ncbi:predicted protein [Naegleria gruberi]|uniref:Predicted protein n=1 Tax=Naegleria gruberi TaxID=5762 RepID=D2VZU3_NAEGR|nr:uncharacterized protein NAEGRDRAFT_74619 [Naegleria gruberi]EFC37631.1 predicted protein [Naegleria gruberi]|eukprot:XP_002670375.1 predicted protein [Naegleria gruberi strain NEG-M]
MNNLLENFTHTLPLLLQQHHLIFKEFYKFEESGGVINSIFMIRAVREGTLEGVELVLRISNCHTFWKGISVRNEVKCILFAEKAGIPTPKIVSYSDNAEESPLGCEYILQERAKGQTLANSWRFLSIKQKVQLLEELIVIVGKLHTNSENKKDDYQVGSLLGSEKSSLGVIVGDCAPLGPFKNLKEMVIEQIDFTLNQISNTGEQVHYPHYLDFVSLHSEPLLDLKSKLLHTDDGVEDPNVYQFCHCDLNASNIMIKSNASLDTAKVSAVLDWPQSRFTSVVKECETLAHWACLLEMLNKDMPVSDMETSFDDKQVRSKVIEIIVPIWEKNGINVTIPDETTFTRHQTYLNILYSIPRLYFFTNSWFHGLMKMGNFDLQLGYRDEPFDGSEELKQLLEDIKNVLLIFYFVHFQVHHYLQKVHHLTKQNTKKMFSQLPSVNSVLFGGGYPSQLSPTTPPFGGVNLFGGASSMMNNINNGLKLTVREPTAEDTTRSLIMMMEKVNIGSSSGGGDVSSNIESLSANETSQLLNRLPNIASEVDDCKDFFMRFVFFYNNNLQFK